MKAQFTKQQRDIFRSLHVLMSAVNWKRFDEYNDEEARQLEEFVENYPDYCSMSCAADNHTDFVELIRKTVADYHRAAFNHRNPVITQP